MVDLVALVVAHVAITKLVFNVIFVVKKDVWNVIVMLIWGSKGLVPVVVLHVVVVVVVVMVPGGSLHHIGSSSDNDVEAGSSGLSTQERVGN